MDIEQLKYPVGKFEMSPNYSAETIQQNIKILEDFPAKLRALTENLTDNELNTPYRPDGWTVRQVVHHLADSHTNMFTRVRLALTEENPSVKGYKEAEWAKLADHSLPIHSSLLMVEGIHARMVYLLSNLDENALKRTYLHHEYQKLYRIEDVIALYAWHSNHHYAHILQALNK